MTAAPTRATVADRIAGTLLGAAIGDALGSAYEMLPNETIEQHLRSSFAREFEPAVRGSLLYRRDAGEPTDDTAMALSVAYTTASGESLTADVFARRFLADLDPAGGRFGRMFWNGGPGGATTQALRRLHMGADAATNGHPDDGGNGAAMRAHPIGCLSNRDDVLDVASVQARVTHAAIAAAQTVAACVFDAIDGRAPSDDLPAGIIDATLIAAWNEAHRGLKRGHRLPVHLRNAAMSGWATVAAAHAIALLYADDPEAAIGAAAASGGDTDTVASIVGAFVGARSGRSALPERWIVGLPDGIPATFDFLATKLVERRLHRPRSQA